MFLYLKVKSDIDHIHVVISQIFTAVTFFGVFCRGVFGSLPYTVVAAIVEVLKATITFNLGILNLSHIAQFAIIYNIRYGLFKIDAKITNNMLAGSTNSKTEQSKP